MVPTFSVQVDSKRLVLARWTSFHAVADAEKFRSDIIEGVSKCDPKAIICADWRNAHVVSPEISEVLYSMLRGVHSHIERSAILLAQCHATFNLQAERLVRDANSPSRRTFRDSDAHLAWLRECLTPAQQASAARFLSEVPHTALAT